MESKLINYDLDGKRSGIDIYRLHLKCIPARLPEKENDEYTCIRFTLQQGDADQRAIPALENWTYVYKERVDDKEYVFRIDQSLFDNLIGSNGNALPPGKTYHVYNSSIDFHSFCDVFAESSADGNGIQDLNEIGQSLVHAAAFSEPPVNLGNNIAEGSYFKNGEITLQFKGLSLVNDQLCALIGYDSGESSYKTIIEPAPNVEIQTVGSSHYQGDIYKDLETNWVQKGTMTEFVVSKTALPIEPKKINSIIERDIVIRNVIKDEVDFE